MTKRADMIGKRFGRWTVLALSDKRGNRGQLMFECICDCGSHGIVMGESLRRLDSKSCGCLKKETVHTVNRTHGGSKERLFSVWLGIKNRCYNKNHKQYKDYGGRGVTLDRRWHDYAIFREFMLSHGYDPEAPHGECTVDRIDVNGNYCPENCRVISLKEQAFNKTNNRLLTFNGKTKTATEWAKELGVKIEVITRRIDVLGWSIEEALTTPKRATEKFTVDGETHTVREWAEILHMPWSTLRGKIKNDKQRLLEIEVRKRIQN